MTTQEAKVKGFVKWVNWNSVITTVCTGAILWMGAGIREIYNDLKKQPYVDERQNMSILSLVSDLGKIKSDNENIKNELTLQGGKIIYLEAILPDKNQFKIKR